MTCDEFENRLQHLLDERLSPADDSGILEHVARCVTCRDTLIAEQQLFAGLRDDGRRRAPRDLAQRVVSEFVANQAAVKTAPIRNRVLATFAVVAAVAVVAVVPMFRPQPAPPAIDQNNAATVVAEPPAPQQPDSQLAIAPQSTELATPSTAADLPNALAASEAFGLSAETWLVSLKESLADVSLESLEPMDRIADGLRPVANSLETAVNALRRNLPGGKEATTKPQPDTSYVEVLRIVFA